MLGSKRRSSRSDLYSTGPHKTQPEQQTSQASRRSSISANSGPRPPFSPLDPLDPQGSQFTLAAAADDTMSPAFNSSPDFDSSISKQSVSTANRDSSDTKYTQSPTSSQASYRLQKDQGRRMSTPSIKTSLLASAVTPSPQLADDRNADLYTYNSLNSFSFGTVKTQTPPSSSRSVHPLSSIQGDADTGDDLFVGPDVTPRPSVVAYHQPHNPVRSHPAQPPGQAEWPPPLRETLPGGPRDVQIDRHRSRHVGRDSDTLSQNTLENSSASASVTSLSSTSAGFSRAGSSASHHTDTTNQTSAQDHLSTDDEDDHRHPIPLHLAHALSLRRSGPSGESSGTGTSTAVEFSSDEEYGDSEYDYDDYYDDGNIEIGSAQFEGSVLTHDWEHDLYSYGTGGGSGSIRGQAPPGSSERRGSLPMAIPGVNPAVGQEDVGFFIAGRNREDSLATLRRPSRSLDDEFRQLGLVRGADPGESTLSEGFTNPSIQPTPISVPGTHGDWRNLEERSKLKGKGKERAHEGSSIATSGIRTQGSQVPPGSGNLLADFDLDWDQMRGGITSLDPNALGDIIGPKPQQAPGSSERRPSAISSRWITWLNNERRPSTATVSSFYSDSFGKAVGKWGGDGYRAQRRDWSFRREKADRSDNIPASPGDVGPGRNSITGLLSPRGSIMTERTGVIPAGLGGRESPKDMDKDRGTRSPSVWRGMQLDSQEVWKNDLVGRFKVDRRATKPTDASKGPQQRLVVVHFRDPYTLMPTPHNGPPVTIHKHSKAIAFSISRHYKARVMSNASRDASFIGGPRRSSVRGDFLSTSSRTTDGIINTLAGGSTVPATKKSSNMILLAPRRVQEAFTSTNTTRKLESHGLLDDHSHAGSPTDVRDRERIRRQKEREREREREREKQKDKERRQKALEDAKKKGKVRHQAKDDSQVATSSAGSVASSSTLISPSLPPPPASAPQLHTYPPGSTTSLTSSVGREVTVGDHNISRNSSHRSRRRRRNHDPLDEDEDEEDDDDAPPTRTPHSEAYGTMDASLIEQLRPRQERSHIGDYESNGSFLRRLIRGRGGHAIPGPTLGQIEPSYEPPWLVLASRNKQEQQQRVVENLNTSFKDVGLLPSTHKDKPKHASPVPKPKKIASGNAEVNIFDGVPSDSLYMLLPLWPGDTDPVSERNAGAGEKPLVPTEERQYLLVYYKLPPDANEDQMKSQSVGESRKRSRNSPTSSHDSATKREDRTSILLSSFHVSARLVSWTNLQGSGVRVPDEGLTVTGPLHIAFQTMPPVGQPVYDYVLGICHSREAGIEFYPDAFIKMGLALQTSSPVGLPMSEEDEIPEPEVELTPVGRAVVEMAWLGALALTSFGPGT
ncbi:hypothetical protein Hypma_007910 [Hypsizygus marmoreus]|uniref:Uncharacterized protein n=1 Tax=Hypsizygus marmoreus TaxID=39966 RepID=A0A369JRM3_HYPMA|nr:hypothetical protein Hypma_007910 [Hypsizygus marmoreus]